uniref:Uncharacterized protein n=1 Tax=Ananas comosus var. bracteatus TaxID=296719 RepID=A0A6V7PWL8_ANACO|nr:unnamed protein product [Ananas comosus var. bracteatus]
MQVPEFSYASIHGTRSLLWSPKLYRVFPSFETPPPPTGLPSLAGCVALVETRGQLNDNAKEILSRGLAARFGGSSGFDELWDTDPLSNQRADVSYFRAFIRCQDVLTIPEAIILTVDDRRFRIPIEIESWEQANPILLSEDLDDQLGLVSTEEQEAFLRQTGFNAFPALCNSDGQSATEENSNSNFSPDLPPPPPYLFADTAAPVNASGADVLSLPPFGPLVTPPTSSCPPTLLSIPCLGLKGKDKSTSDPIHLDSSPPAMMGFITSPASHPTGSSIAQRSLCLPFWAPLSSTSLPSWAPLRAT